MNLPLPRPSLSLAFNLAWTHTSKVLFQPFDLGRWFVLGFCAWLAALGENGLGFTGQIPGRFNVGKPQAGHFDFNPKTILSPATDFWHANITWLLSAIILGGIALLVIGLVLMWLNSRGKFMLLHCVAYNTAEIQSPWNAYAHSANRLFLLRLVTAVCASLIVIPLIIVSSLVLLNGLKTGVWDPKKLVALAGVAILFAFPLSLIFAAFQKLTVDFGVPIMMKLGCGPLTAWRQLWPLVAGRLGSIFLYLLFSIVLTIAIGLATIILVICTCCTAGCLLMIPYINAVVLLPCFVFLRSFSALYFGLLAPQFDVFPEPSPLKF